jgi:dephospho-CoA kinase
MGKTTVLRFFAKLGAHTFNSDEYVQDILRNSKIIKKLTDVLGKNILSKSSSYTSINKKSVTEIIFNEPHKRKAVEKIIHPEVLNAIKVTESKIIDREPSATIVYEVPLLFEAGYENIFDKTVVVFCNRATAVKRVTKKGISKEDAYKRIHAQMPITRKKKLADFLINNNKDMKKTERQVERIFNKITCKGNS